MTKHSFRKGDVVTTTRELRGYYIITQAERAEWYASPAAKGHTSAGETKLPPMSKSVYVGDRGTVGVIVKGRCAPVLGYGNPRPGYTLVKFTTYPRPLFIHRSDVEDVKE